MRDTTPRISPRPADKILTRDDLLARRQALRAAGRRLVHCHGCFDIVHPGHVRHLRSARSLGDVLLVSITGDSGVSKGAARPLIPQELRAENLAELDCVDWVYIDPHPTAEPLLAAVQPDVYVKGREYEFNDDPRFRAERDTVERAGGRVVFTSGEVVFSSTALIEALSASADPFQSRLAQLAARPELDIDTLTGHMSGWRDKRLVVVGETIIDTYVFCDRPEVAGESPVMTLRPVERRTYDGGAAVIARHAAALGARPTLVTVLPRDNPTAQELRFRLEAEGVEVRAIDADAPIAEKQRFLVGAQKVMKLDLVPQPTLDARQHDALLNLAREAAADSGGCDGAIIADFGLGLLTPPMVRRLCRSLRPVAGVLAGDVSGRRHALRSMRRLDLACPSEAELRDAYALHDEGLSVVAWRLLQETRTRAAIVTMGPEGLIAFDRLTGAETPGGDPYRPRVRGEHVPAMTPHAVDALGCGDALLTTATLALCAGAPLIGAAFLGSAAAAVHARRLGNPPLSLADMRQSVTRLLAARLAWAGTDAVRVVAGRVRAAS